MNFLDKLSMELYGMTRQEAHTKWICICCKSPITEKNILTEAGSREYRISAFCEKCFNTATLESED